MRPFRRSLPALRFGTALHPEQRPRRLPRGRHDGIPLGSPQTRVRVRVRAHGRAGAPTSAADSGARSPGVRGDTFSEHAAQTHLVLPHQPLHPGLHASASLPAGRAASSRPAALQKQLLAVGCCTGASFRNRKIRKFWNTGFTRQAETLRKPGQPGAHFLSRGLWQFQSR